MKLVLWEVLPSTLLVASEVFISSFAVTWLVLSSIFPPSIWPILASGVGTALALIAAYFFGRRAIRTVREEAALRATVGLDEGLRD